ncbi:MAG: hypothetical protein ACE5GO_09605 [Anaerolineales bacterium]
MSILSRAERYLKRIICPHCQETGLSVVRCRDEGGEEKCMAYCQYCRYSLPIEGDGLVALKRVQEYIAGQLGRTVCPNCSQLELRFSAEFGCDVVNNYCFFKVTCRACRQSFWVVDHYNGVTLTRLR